MNKETLLNSVKKWISLDDKIKDLGKQIKEIRNEKKELTDVLVDTMKENDGEVYWWGMADFHLSYKPHNSYYQWDKGVVSHKTYFQGDCGIVRVKVLSRTFYQQGMLKGKGIPSKYASSSDWSYPSPGTVGKDLLDFVCDSLK